MHSDLWKRVLMHELSRRRRFLAEHPKEYEKVFSMQLKPLDESCKSPHVWIPATTIMIHDGGRGSHTIHGHSRRALREAAPYRADGYIYIPQVCWNCSTTRVLILQHTTYEQRELLRKQNKLKRQKPKGRLGSTGEVLTNFEDLCI